MPWSSILELRLHGWQCQGSDTHSSNSFLPSFPAKAGAWDRAGNSSPSSAQPIAGHSPAGSDSPATNIDQTLPCLHTSSPAAVSGSTSDAIRGKTGSHQSGWAGVIAYTSLDSFTVVNGFAYQGSCLCFQLSFLLPSSVLFKGPYMKMGQ